MDEKNKLLEILRKLSKILKTFLKKIAKNNYFVQLSEKRKLCEILRKYSKILKNFLRKLLKVHHFSIFFKKLNKPCVTFCAFERNTDLLESLRIFSKVFKRFLKKIPKMHLAYFAKD